MARVLIVVPPLTGHLNPTLALGAELARHGHTVTWTGHRDFVQKRLPVGARFAAAAERMPQPLLDAIGEQTVPLRGMAALRFLWNDFILPLADDMLPSLERVVDEVAPDVIVADQQAIAGAAVAEARGIPWVTSATTTGELSNPASDMPQVEEWRHGMVQDFLVRAGVPADRAADVDPRFSPHLVVLFSTEALVGPDRTFPGHYAFVGPALAERRVDETFDWDLLDPERPLVLVSLGSVNAVTGRRFFEVTAEALAGLDVQAVMVAPRSFVPDPPANVLVREWVPQLPLLRLASAVVSHGGQNTVSESLALGVPMVLAPIRDDQPTIADQVVAAGAGLRVRFGRVGVPQMREAISAVLGEPSFSEGARRVQESYAAAGGVAAAADRIGQLVGAAVPA
ncbi:glycosyltransferase [Nocardioides ultimimeridianus]